MADNDIAVAKIVEQGGLDLVDQGFEVFRDHPCSQSGIDRVDGCTAGTDQRLRVKVDPRLYSGALPGDDCHPVSQVGQDTGVVVYG